MAGLSWLLTPRLYRERQEFDFAPMVEVAVLFVGIFVTMIPALMLLEERGAQLGLVHPWQFFWDTGLLSSFLDNAPTYLTFFTLAQAGRWSREFPKIFWPGLRWAPCLWGR